MAKSADAIAENVVESEVDLKARNRHLEKNGWAMEAYDAAWTEATVFGVSVRFPNTDSHRRGIMLHDFDHVATGNGKDPIGEGEISLWEMPWRGAARFAVQLLNDIFSGSIPRTAIQMDTQKFHC